MLLSSCAEVLLDYTSPTKGEGQNSIPATVSGLVRDILENARNPDGKILNGLEFPAWDGFIKERRAYSTDVVAWDYLRGKPYCGDFTTPYPTAHMHWGLAGTADAVTFLHNDSDGFSTFVGPVCGKKIWGIYREHPELPLSSPDVFLDDNFLLDEVLDSSKFGLEAIVLRPGDLLYGFIILLFNLLTPFSFMRPGIPHFVYGPENTICYGGHFYVTCLMQLSLQSLVHGFVVGEFITNISHHPSQALLRRIVILYGRGLVEDCLRLTGNGQGFYFCNRL